MDKFVNQPFLNPNAPLLEFGNHREQLMIGICQRLNIPKHILVPSSTIISDSPTKFGIGCFQEPEEPNTDGVQHG